ncbi:hypothetical protein C9412_05840 [Stenotrophomonas sp. Nf1]|nr:hypothetical protein C9412_05840 [Stenotrophomonas sp. Nf1]PTA78889.1 hypothetical protein C9416_12635 [Stenotrophomonas sp. Nf4]
MLEVILLGRCAHLHGYVAHLSRAEAMCNVGTRAATALKDGDAGDSGGDAGGVGEPGDGTGGGNAGAVRQPCGAGPGAGRGRLAPRQCQRAGGRAAGGLAARLGRVPAFPAFQRWQPGGQLPA